MGCIFKLNKLYSSSQHPMLCAINTFCAYDVCLRLNICSLLIYMGFEILCKAIGQSVFFA
ncbi:hypothetical protein ACE6H2_016269 [Prunus campanulata]